MTRLRLAIGSFDGSHSVVEVIDADGIHVAQTPGGDPVVGVSLARPASSPAEPLAGLTADLDKDRVLEVLSQHLAQQPNSDGKRSEDADLDGKERYVQSALCKVFNNRPWWC